MGGATEEQGLPLSEGRRPVGFVESTLVSRKYGSSALSRFLRVVDDNLLGKFPIRKRGQTNNSWLPNVIARGPEKFVLFSVS